MSRTRRALLTGAAQAVAVSGTRIAMAQVASVSGVAKATLYNHFRTRDAVLDALLLHEVTTLVESVEDLSLERALADTAVAISTHPVRDGLADVEPGTLARLATVDPDAPGWALARAGLDAQLARAGRGGADLVLRWLASFLVTPADGDAVRADVELLLAALPAAATATAAHRAAG